MRHPPPRRPTPRWRRARHHVGDATISPTSGQAYVDMRETSGNGDTRQRPQPDQRDQRQRDDRREGARPQGGRPDAGQQQRVARVVAPTSVARRAPSPARGRRQREIEMREEELQTAPTATRLLDILPEGYGFMRTSGYLRGSRTSTCPSRRCRRFMLRKGDTVTGKVGSPRTARSTTRCCRSTR